MTTPSRDYNRAYYARNIEKRRKQIRTRNLVAIGRNKEAYLAWIREQVCVDCGCGDSRILQLDHLGDKRLEVSNMLRTAYSWAAIEAEIKKCEVVCPNCHAVRTGTRGNHFRFAA